LAKSDARKLRAQVAAEVMGRDYDTSLDLNLRLWLVQNANQLANRIDVFPDVGDD
jgi:hypothetical protein